MLDCRYYDLCCFTDDSCNGEPECPKRGYCQFYSPMPDVKALLELADEMETADPEDLDVAIDYVTECASRIREALGVSDDA